VNGEQLRDEQEVSSSAPTDERALDGLTPGVLLLAVLAGIVLWALWIALCVALVQAWTPDPPPWSRPG
jgi:hypothetical protein